MTNDTNKDGNTEMFILCDFNINYLDKKSDSYKCLHRFALLTNLKQYVKCATQKEHCLDLIYNNSDNISNSGVLDIMLSDHELVFVSRKKVKTAYNYVHFRGRSYRNYVKEEDNILPILTGRATIRLKTLMNAGLAYLRL